MQVKDAPKIDFAKMDGLVPGIVQDAKTGEMLMLGFLNEVSYAKTLESGFVTFWSRTRQKLWMKGETSGNRLKIVTAATDCDNDTLLFRVEVEGDGLVCHEGTVSCFTKPISVTTCGRPSNGEQVEAGNSKGKFAGCNDCAVRARGLADFRKRAQLLSGHRR
jgi:phosphoribosyl-AMP cyclohydrolase